jgi:hypothetical protein
MQAGSEVINCGYNLHYGSVIMIVFRNYNINGENHMLSLKINCVIGCQSY